MAKTPDRHPGESDEEGIVFENWSPGNDPPTVGGARLVDGSFRLRDYLGVFDPRSGSGLSESQHEQLDTLTHEIAENAHVVVTRSSGQVSSVVVWTDNTLTTKIRETNITRSSGQVSQIEVKQYDSGGVLKNTVTQTVTRSSGQITSVAVVKT
jgi:hypothetical protein